jgi:hypothetical protein
MSTTEPSIEPGNEQEAQQSSATSNDAVPDEPAEAPGHVPIAQRLSLVSWGESSWPSEPSIDTDIETSVSNHIQTKS